MYAIRSYYGMRKAETADGRVQGKTVDALAGGVDQHGRRAVNHITGGHLTMPRLQEIGQGNRRTRRGDAPVDGENGAHRHVDVNV